MIKKIDLGKTYLKDLHQVFKLSNQDELDKRKARLFPSGNTDNETLTTSIFLASLSAVKEYREELFLSIGINKIKNRNVNLHVFTEINDSDNKNIPDGYRWTPLAGQFERAFKVYFSLFHPSLCGLQGRRCAEV